MVVVEVGGWVDVVMVEDAGSGLFGRGRPVCFLVLLRDGFGISGVLGVAVLSPVVVVVFLVSHSEFVEKAFAALLFFAPAGFAFAIAIMSVLAQFDLFST